MSKSKGKAPTQKQAEKEKENQMQKKQDIEEAIGAYEGTNKNEETLNEKSSQFVNSSTLPGAMFYAGKEIPLGMIRALAWKYVTTVNKLLSKFLFYMGVEIGASDEDILEQAKDATANAKRIGEILKMVMEDPEVRELVKDLAMQLNNSVFKPFLGATALTLEEAAPRIDDASDEVRDKVYNGIRKVTDSAGNAILSGLGTVPYIGNILNATELIANIALGVQGIVDQYTKLILDQTLKTLITIQKLLGPGNAALDIWVNFALNASNSIVKFRNAYDKLSAAAQGKEFTPTPLKTRASLVESIEKDKARIGVTPDLPLAPGQQENNDPISPEELEGRMAALDMPKVPGQKDGKDVTEDELEGRMAGLSIPEAPTTTVKSKASPIPVAADKPKPAKKKTKVAAGGGRKKKRKKKTKKRNQKKRTKRKSRRRK